jgi:hypothetical protein
MTHSYFPPMDGPWPVERAFPRLQYPSHRRPYLVTSRETCEVVDCSERGVRYGSTFDLRPLGSIVSATIHFRCGAEVTVRGLVVRVHDGEVALELEETHGIPADVIAAEESALREF